MLPIYSSSVSGMESSQQVLNITSNNIANVDTFGFDASDPIVTDLIYQGVDPRNLVNSTYANSSAIGVGSQLQSTSHAQIPGSPVATGNPLDVTIGGDGYFQTLQPNGTMGYTRLGALRFDGAGNLNINGALVQPPITLPSGASEVTVTSAGEITAQVSGQQQNIGQLQLARFINPQGLSAIGSTTYAATVDSGKPITGTPFQNGFGGLIPNTLEAPRVDLSKEMANMIVSERSFQLNAQSLQTINAMLAEITH